MYVEISDKNRVRICVLNKDTHSKNITLLFDSVPLDISLKACFFKFAKKTICHKNKAISYVMKIAVSNPCSLVGRNYRNLCGT